MTLSHIVAASENNVIGVGGALPWSIPEDTQFFRDKTKGHAVIMGRKTYESLGKPLPGRLNVVVTRQSDFRPAGVTVVSTIDEAIKVCEGQTAKWGDEVFIIGGGEIYKQSMDKVDLIYLTRIHQKFDGDAFYPNVPSTFQEIERRDRTEPVPYSFLTYARG